MLHLVMQVEGPAHLGLLLEGPADCYAHALRGEGAGAVRTNHNGVWTHVVTGFPTTPLDNALAFFSSRFLQGAPVSIEVEDVVEPETPNAEFLQRALPCVWSVFVEPETPSAAFLRAIRRIPEAHL